MPTCYRHPGRETYIRCQRCDRPICPDCMRDAAVGFQCPECVARARSPPAAGGRRTAGCARPTPSLTSIVLIGDQRRGLARDPGDRRRRQPAGRLARRCGPTGSATLGPRRSTDVHRGRLPGAAAAQLAARRRRRRLLAAGHRRCSPTSTIWHIGFNMLALWVLGPQLELAIGRARFLALYLLSGAGRLGAGLLGRGRVRLDPRRLRRDLRPDGRAAGRRASRSAATCSAILTLDRDQRPDHVRRSRNISWQGHLGGFVGGARDRGASSSTPRAAPRRTPGPGRRRWSRDRARSSSVADRRPHRRARLSHRLGGYPQLWTHLWRTTAVLFTCVHTCGQSRHRCANRPARRVRVCADRGHSQRVAKVKPTAMKPMPTTGCTGRGR